MGSARSSNGGGSADRNNLQAQDFQLKTAIYVLYNKPAPYLRQCGVGVPMTLSTQSSCQRLVKHLSHHMPTMINVANRVAVKHMLSNTSVYLKSLCAPSASLSTFFSRGPLVQSMVRWMF